MLGIRSRGWGIVVVVGLVNGIVSFAGVRADAGVIPFSVLSAILATGAMALVARDSALPRNRLWISVFLLGFWVEHASSLVEAIAFEVVPLRAAAAGVVFGALLTVPLSWVAIEGSCAVVPDDRQHRGFRVPALRIAAAVLVFVVSYIVAGALVYPFVREFYAGRALPPVGPLFGLQALRGSVLVVVTLPLLAASASPVGVRVVRWAAALAILAGVAPLITPNPAFPDAVRFAHMLEVGGSHLMIGSAFAVLLRPRPVRRAEPVPA